MKVKTRISVLFTLISSLILILFNTFIYHTAKKNREKEFYSIIKKEAITKANLFFNAKIEPKTLQNIYLNNRLLINEVEVAIYDTLFNLLYHDAYEIDFVKETPSMIKSILQNREITFYQNEWQVVGFSFTNYNQTYIITAAAYDQQGFNQLYKLKESMIYTSILGIFFISLIGYFFSEKTLQPIKKITEKAREISATNLHLRLETSESKDELSILAETFNEMLDRLNKAFQAQNEFVSHIAHEIRTPLTSITTEIELALIKERSINEYNRILKESHKNAKKLVKLINNLLDFAKASYDKSVINFKPLRIDEILLDAKIQVQKNNPDYDVSLFFENEIEDENDIIINGNEYFLKTAFINLIENGCKYSTNKHTTINVSIKQIGLEIKFIDNGIGVPEEDIPFIFEPFFRGKNKNYVDGSGIGLALVSKVISIHNGTISVNSIVNKGTTFCIFLPKLVK